LGKADRTFGLRLGCEGMKKIRAPRAAQRASAPERIDAAAARAAAEYRDAPPVKAATAFAKLADQPPLFAIGAVTLVAGVALRQPRLVRAGLRMLASEAAATGIKAAVKHFVARTRPGKMRKDGRYALHADAEGKKDDGPWNSFPSGHTAGAVAVARALSREYPAAGPVAGAAASVVAAAQVPAGAHFPSDVAAGAAIGWAAEALVDAGARQLAAKSPA
jgi:membrane-associated phospholipid phosphatase